MTLKGLEPYEQPKVTFLVTFEARPPIEVVSHSFSITDNGAVAYFYNRQEPSEANCYESDETVAAFANFETVTRKSA